jgi:hypothetical protein
MASQPTTYPVQTQVAPNSPAVPTVTSLAIGTQPADYSTPGVNRSYIIVDGTNLPTLDGLLFRDAQTGALTRLRIVNGALTVG